MHNHHHCAAAPGLAAPELIPDVRTAGCNRPNAEDEREQNPTDVNDEGVAVQMADEARARAGVEASDKLTTSAIAEAARRGVVVHIVGKPGGGHELLALKWQHCRTFSTAGALQQWLQRMGGTK